ncbi:MAG TPA: hypothetical protein VGP72_12975 [Planctomycetota bacterium]|jgi:hypothetical protein
MAEGIGLQTEKAQTDGTLHKCALGQNVAVMQACVRAKGRANTSVAPHVQFFTEEALVEGERLDG